MVSQFLRFLSKSVRIENNFFESFIVRSAGLSGIILGTAILSVIARRYSVFLTYLPIILVGLGAFILLLLIVNWEKIWRPEARADFLVLSCLFVFVVFNGSRFSEYATIQGGNDVGAYFEGATVLAKTGDYFEDWSKKPFIISTPGYYPNTETLTRMAFIPGNPTYFSIFYHYFGINGFPVGLSLALFLSGSFIYFLCKRIRGWRVGAVFLIFFLVNYYTIFFSRALWVENLQMLLIWSYAYLIVRAFQEKNFTLLLAASLPVALLMHFRLEAMLYVVIYLLVIVFVCIRRGEFRIWRKENLVPVILLAAFALTLIVSVFVFDPNALLTDDESSLRTIVKTITRPGANIAWHTGALIPYTNRYLFGRSSITLSVQF
jgi:hypothetical protein